LGKGGFGFEVVGVSPQIVPKPAPKNNGARYGYNDILKSKPTLLQKAGLFFRSSS
jgi:hypothetical protein